MEVKITGMSDLDQDEDALWSVVSVMVFNFCIRGSITVIASAEKGQRLDPRNRHNGKTRRYSEALIIIS